jgi:hypothetical protein
MQKELEIPNLHKALNVVCHTMTQFQFNKIYVIESLFPEDEKSGEILHNDIIRRKIEQTKSGIEHELILVNNKEEFFKAFDYIRQEVIYRLVNPIIHFEIHGCKEGFVLNSDELIEWKDLQMRLLELNLLTKNNLFLSLATCYGGHIHKVISPRMWTPFWGYVGLLDEVYEDQVMAGFQEFFDELLTSLNFGTATQRLNQNNPKLPTEFYFCNTEYVFNRAYANYEQKYLTDEVVAKRLEAGLNEARQYKEVQHLTDDQVKQFLKYWMVDQKDFLKNQMMEHFFMYDVFPELRPK